MSARWISKGPFKGWVTYKHCSLKERFSRWKIAWCGLGQHLIHVITFGALEPEWWETSLAEYIFPKTKKH